MIRLTLLLLAGMFATLQIGGRDNGQMRFGLVEAEKEAALARSIAVSTDAAQTVAQNDNILPAEPVVIGTATPVVEVAFAPAKVVAPAETDAATTKTAARKTERLGEIRYVSGRSVNVRSGPSTRDTVVDKLARGDEVSVVWVEDNGWARIRIEGDGIEGYMSADFLTENAP